MNLTTIIPWRQRPELAQSLRHNTPLFRAMGSEVVVVNCGGDAEALRRLLASPDLIETTQIDLPVERFNISRARNIGAHVAKAGVLFFLDADVLIPGDLRSYVDLCAEGQSYVMFRRMVDQPRKKPPIVKREGSLLEALVGEWFMTFEWSDGRSTRIRTAWLDFGRGSRLGTGQIMVRKQDVVELGGFRSDLVGWGWEDLDFHLRLQTRLGIEPVYIQEELVHLAHADNKRDVRKGESKGHTERANMLRSCQSYCDGNFSGTYDADVAEWQAALHEPRPAPANARWKHARRWADVFRKLRPRPS
jgi:glycosyltransferase involved in cell wall biosynthesis